MDSFLKTKHWLLFFSFLYLVACNDNQIIRSTETEPTQLEIKIEKDFLLEEDSVLVNYVFYGDNGDSIDFVPPWLEPNWSIADENIFHIENGKLIAIRDGESDLSLHVGDFSTSVPVKIYPLRVNLSVESEGEGSVTKEIVQPGDADNTRATVNEVMADSAVYSSGTVVELTGNSEGEWFFDRWKGDHESDINPTSITLIEDQQITAVFKYASFAGAYMVQTVQSLDNPVALIPNQKALLRVFVTANRSNTTNPPTIKAKFNSQNHEEIELTLEPPNTIPDGVEEGKIGLSWSIPVPANIIAPGMQVNLELDSAKLFSSYEQVGANFHVQDVPDFNVTFVPVHQPGIGTGNINPSNVEEHLDATRRVFPLDEVDVTIRNPFTTSHTADTQEGRQAILSELSVLRNVENTNRYYHGILKGNVGGRAYIRGPVAISAENRPWTVAHEFGHNFGLRHAPCGNAPNVDEQYPYPGGQIGVYGYDRMNSEIINPETADLMGYCRPRWISDYHFEKVLDFRINEAEKSSTKKIAATKSLLIWGRISSKEIIIEPSFTVRSQPVLPNGKGDFRMELFDTSGNIVYSELFSPDEVADGLSREKHFAFNIPKNQIGATEINEIRIAGNGRQTSRSSVLSQQKRIQLKSTDSTILDLSVSKQRSNGLLIRWDAQKYPMIMVRDRGSGEVISFARNGEAVIQTESGSVELNISHGVGSFNRLKNIN